MKDLSYDELLKAPAKVQFLYVRAMLKEPVGISMCEEAMKEHPEYFPDELEYRRKYALIPQHVHDLYYQEKDVLHNECYKSLPASKGLIGWLDDPKGYEEWNKVYTKCREKEKPLEEALHKKHYSEYGI